MPEENSKITFKYCGLGDVWASCSYVAINHPLSDVRLRPRGVQLSKTVTRLLGVDMNVDFINPDNDHELDVLSNLVAYNHEYLPTKIRWENRRSRIISFQFDSRSNKDLKNCSSEEISRFREVIFKSGYRLVDLGNTCDLTAAVNIMSISEVFIGLDSGMSHVAQSVGVPIFLIANQMKKDFLQQVYNNKPIVFYQTMEHLLSNKIDEEIRDFEKNKGNPP